MQLQSYSKDGSYTILFEKKIQGIVQFQFVIFSKVFKIPNFALCNQ